MPSRLPSDRELDRTASRTTTRYFFLAVGIAALIGLGIGILWTLAGLLHFHPLG
jgi:hypothetical protein